METSGRREERSERAGECEEEGGEERTVVDNGMMGETGPLGDPLVFFTPFQMSVLTFLLSIVRSLTIVRSFPCLVAVVLVWFDMPLLPLTLSPSSIRGKCQHKTDCAIMGT